MMLAWGVSWVFVITLCTLATIKSQIQRFEYGFKIFSWLARLFHESLRDSFISAFGIESCSRKIYAKRCDDLSF